MAKEKKVIEDVQGEVKVQDEVTKTDAPIYAGGPLQSQVDEWKGAYGQVYLTEVDDDDTFIWRVLNRKEFKEVMKVESDAMYREERVCELCILWPEDYTFDSISDGKAGVPTILSEQIMEKSGFAPKTGPIAI